PEQVADFLKGRVVGQIVDVIPAIGEHSLVTVDLANAGGGSDNPFQSFGGVQARNAGHGSSMACGWIYVARLRKKGAAGQLSFIRQSGGSLHARPWPGA